MIPTELPWAADPLPLRVTEDLNSAAVSYPLHVRAILHGLPYHRAWSWSTDLREVPREIADDAAPPPVYWGKSYGNSELLIQDASLSLRIQMDAGGQVHVDGGTTDLERLEGIAERLRDGALPESEPDPEEQRVPVAFWSLGPHGPQQRTRKIDVPEWGEISRNYPGAIRGELGAMMDQFAPGVGGQLMLWHGPPGTGKTWAIRALAWEWRSWCSVHYITDPEVFFGDRAAYMLDVLLHEDDGNGMTAMARRARRRGEEVETDARAEGGRWRLLVMEDTGELMSADARARSGQGLSRLLNVVDGLIGQGLRVLVLVTTNEELKTLHDAVSRPGRCAANVLFSGMAPDEAAEWLEDADADAEVARPTTLADLYALAERRRTSRDRPEPRKVAGFT